MENVVHHAPLAIYCVDNSGIVTLWNRAAEELFGFAEKEIIGQRDPSIPHEDCQQLCMDVFYDTSGKVVERKCKQGYTLDVMIWTSPLMDDSGNIIGRTVMAAKASETNIVHDLEKTRSIVDRILETVT
jgi:PAS domain S-box-containing protein